MGKNALPSVNVFVHYCDRLTITGPYFLSHYTLNRFKNIL